VCALIESALRHNGYTTGLYTSPFLISYPERIRLNGKSVDDALFEKVGKPRVRGGALDAGSGAHRLRAGHGGGAVGRSRSGR
jgi:folylpolyglutamate synthase/dihydropteroate synthase